MVISGICPRKTDRSIPTAASPCSGKSTRAAKSTSRRSPTRSKKADRLILATDPDREGEAISWHVQDELAPSNLLKNKDIKRVVFNEITKRAILEAMANPRDVDQELVQAYLARRALDYLVGFNLSPVLWRKLPGSRSAGRVQSVALRLICEREREIEDFRTDEYWTIDGAFLTPSGAPFSARLTRFDGKKLDKLSIGGETQAKAIELALRRASFSVGSVERKTAKRHPYAPFTTSTLQQEAARKLHFGAKKTMEVAQRLYEGVDLGGETVGLITYMRTDGVQIAQEAIAVAREVIARDFGQAYLPPQPRLYKTKAKNAQEAHEAIRPTDLARTPASVAHVLNKDQLRLYELIWKRTLASQMESAVLDQVAVDVDAPEAKATLHATGSIVAFDGFLKVYREDADDAEGKADETDRRLPPMQEGQTLALSDILSEQHFTQPPPRYSEASLVKKLEELGIGRPSTYASIISVLQDRDYVRLDQRRFIPEDRGRVVTAFLENYFSRYVQYTFTADLERRLDEISDGKLPWQTVLSDFWGDFRDAVEATRELRVSQVLDRLDADLGAHFFPPKEDGSDPRACPQCGDGRLGLRLGKPGAFIGCSNYPACPTPALEPERQRQTRRRTRDRGTAHPRPDTASVLTVSVRMGPMATMCSSARNGKNRPPPAPVPRNQRRSSRSASPCRAAWTRYRLAWRRRWRFWPCRATSAPTPKPARSSRRAWGASVPTSSAVPSTSPWPRPTTCCPSICPAPWNCWRSRRRRRTRRRTSGRTPPTASRYPCARAASAPMCSTESCSPPCPRPTARRARCRSPAPSRSWRRRRRRPGEPPRRRRRRRTRRTRTGEKTTAKKPARRNPQEAPAKKAAKKKDSP
jgi:DNA topoisomerase-1